MLSSPNALPFSPYLRPSQHCLLFSINQLSKNLSFSYFPIPCSIHICEFIHRLQTPYLHYIYIPAATYAKSPYSTVSITTSSYNLFVFILGDLHLKYSFTSSIHLFYIVHSKLYFSSMYPSINSNMQP